MFARTGCDGVMIGRAAVQKPWIFAEVLGKEPEISADFLWATYQEAWRLVTESYPEHQALGLSPLSRQCYCGISPHLSSLQFTPAPPFTPVHDNPHPPAVAPNRKTLPVLHSPDVPAESEDEHAPPATAPH